MATSTQINRARQCLASIANGLNAINMKYDRNDRDFCLEFRARSHQGLTLDILIHVLPAHEVVEYYFITDIAVPANRYTDVAMAVCCANNAMLIGGFECTADDEYLCFKISDDYSESYPGRETVRQTMLLGGDMVDNYGDYFYKLCRGTMKLKQFLAVVAAR